MATRRLPPRFGVSVAGPPRGAMDKPRPTAPASTPRRLMPARAPRDDRSYVVIYLSVEEPRAVLANLDQRGPIGGERILRGADQMLRARGADGMTAESLGDPDEIGALRLDADARHLPLVHLVDDLLVRMVVPDDHRKGDPLLRGGGEFVDGEHDPSVPRDCNDRPMRRTDLRAYRHRQRDSQRAVASRVVPAAFHLHGHRERARV